MLAQNLHAVLRQLDNDASGAGRPAPQLLAVAKTQPASAVAELVVLGQSAFGENYVQEASAKRAELARLVPELPELVWHLIGHLQSNKAREAAALFDWVQTVDRDKLVGALARHRRNDQAPLNVLIQVNIDDETSKHGCAPDAVAGLAVAILREPKLRLRGLMAIPAPSPDQAHRRDAFRRMRVLFDELQRGHADIDTLSMGMSNDAALAIAEGATMVRVGTALFGARPKPTE